MDALLSHLDGRALVVTFPPDVRWLTGFTGSNALVIVTAAGAVHLVTDGRYTTQAQAEVQDATVHIADGSLIEHAAAHDLLPDGPVVVQADRLSVAQLERLQEQQPAAMWQPERGVLQALVARKRADEVEKLRAAQAITDAVFEHLCDWLRPGQTEQEVAAEIVYQHLRRGAERMAFDPIVASGPNGALPHARPTSRRLQAGDVVVIDMGGVRAGYASDMTRTVAIGAPAPAVRTVYDVVLAAQEAALQAAVGGIASDALDAAARSVIEDAGHGEAFPHSLGHGIGLQTHEWPRVSHRSSEPLPTGAVITIEPGIYRPDRFGVRIEDMIHLTPEGHDNLTASPKDLIVIS
ncbi:M24 family metallopeptidase [Salisaeta longa]|uniref:M24 family metallopeptidase n=1 Tax=Salisaeta longa TaxID=503170 RepID=UPI0003B310CE|nr:aminopeptidase P family protein [Salisaeta longa]